MEHKEEKHSGRVRDPIGRAIHILRYMVDQPQNDFGVREVAKACGMLPGTVHRTLNALLEERFVDYCKDTETYRVGLDMVRLGVRAAEKIELRQKARPVMERISEAFNETVLLGSYNPRTQLMSRIDSVESSHPLRYVFELYEWTEVYRGASGLAILANLSEEEQGVILRQAERDASVMWEGKAAAVAELSAIEEQGYALTYGRRVDGAVGIASPIFDYRDVVVGDLIVTVPEQRFDDAIHRRLVEMLPKAAVEISKNMGAVRTVEERTLISP